MLAIINAELVMKDHLIPDAVIFVEDGKISGFGEMRGAKIPEGAKRVVLTAYKANGLYASTEMKEVF